MFKRATAIFIAAAIVLTLAPGVSFAAGSRAADGVRLLDDSLMNANNADVTSVILNIKSSVMMPGESLLLSAAVLPETAPEPAITWTSSNEAAAVVDQNGVVTAIGLGSTSITAESGGISDICEITVAEQAYTVSFDSQGGSSLSDIRAAADSLIAEPEAPAMEGYTFEGWYKDKKSRNGGVSVPIKLHAILRFGLYGGWKVRLFRAAALRRIRT